jgi:TDG/mug DNA glycosylase family protein
MLPPPKPTKEALEQAKDKTVPDTIAPGLRVLFCGINPGLYTAAIQAHFGRPGNRFWPALFAAGFTPRLLQPWEKQEMLALGLGITNVAPRATARADELPKEELEAGARGLVKRVEKYKPRVLAILGAGAYRTAFHRPKAKIGLQAETLGDTRIWVLPNPSGLNAHYQPQQLAKLFGELKAFVDGL